MKCFQLIFHSIRDHQKNQSGHIKQVQQAPIQVKSARPIIQNCDDVDSIIIGDIGKSNIIALFLLKHEVYSTYSALISRIWCVDGAHNTIIGLEICLGLC